MKQDTYHSPASIHAALRNSRQEYGWTKKETRGLGASPSSWSRDAHETPSKGSGGGSGGEKRFSSGLFRNDKRAINDDASFRVERIDSASCLALGDVVGYEFVSEDGRWTWSIGTVIASGDGSDDTIGHVDRNSTVSEDPILVSLACWKIAPDTQGDPPTWAGKHEDHEQIDVRRRMEEIEEEKAELSRRPCMEKVMEAERIAETARETLRLAVRGERNVLRQMTRPPNELRLAVNAAFSLLRIELLVEKPEDEWDHMRRVLCSDSFDENLSEADASRLDEAQSEFIKQRFLNNPLFTYLHMNATSHIAALMQKWVTCEVQLYECRKELQFTEMRLAELSQEAMQNERELRLHLNSKELTRTASNPYDEENVRYALQSFQDLGQVSFSRGDEATIVVRSSVFCKFVASTSSPISTLDSMTIHRDRLACIRSAASGKQRRLPFGSSFSEADYPERRYNQSRDAVYQTKLLYEQSIERERILVRELEQLYEKHVRYTMAQHEILLRSTDFAASSYRYSKRDATRLTVAEDRVRELEEALRQEGGKLRTLQMNHEKEIWRMQEEAKRRSLEAAQYISDEVSTIRLQQVSLQGDEEIGRLQLAANEARRWSALLLLEMRKSKDLVIADMRQEYIREMNLLRDDLSNRERRQVKTIKILEDLLAYNGEGREYQQQEMQRRAIKRALKTLCGSMSTELSSDSSPRHFSRNPTSSQGATSYRLPVRSNTPARGISNLEATVESRELEEDNVVILKDRLVEAVRDRDLIHEMLIQEQRKNHSLGEENAVLRSELDREMQERVEVEKTAQKLQDEIAAISGSVRSTPNGYIKSGSDNEELGLREEIAKLQGVIATYDGQLDELLEAEGIENKEAPFHSLREYIAEIKASCVAMQEERDAQAADAKMLESCLKTAANALEDALIHDERWRPHITDSHHTTWHWKKFDGSGWDRVIAETPEALEKALVHGIAAACHVPEEYVLNLTYHDEATCLYASFDLRHDPAISDEDIMCRLEECNYYELERLYTHRFSPEEGIDSLRRKMREKEEELQELRATIAHMRGDSKPPGSGRSKRHLLGV
ncbi:Flagellum attachment zone protein 4 [Trypanosoma cruzi]|uniref:Flagellum attachment zone protein 4 n=1 Tax=Trypanosoma cruzi TaxID=5693 RepID=A0A7J6Y359_TRYCR|nr:Flagellum attachment zone protein 4 [Trypanosoma cruzi]